MAQRGRRAVRRGVGGLLSPSQRADVVIAGLGPAAWLDPPRNTQSGGKVTAYIDRANGSLYQQATVANQNVPPVPVAIANNAIGAVFDGVDDFYASAQAVTFWNYLHLATHTTYAIWVPASLASNQIVWSNHIPTNAGAFLFGSLPAAGAHQATTQDNTGAAANQSSGGTCTVGAVKCLRITRGAVDFKQHDNGTQTYTGAVNNTPSNPASQPLLIGALQTTANFPLNGTLLAFISYARELNPSELARFSDACVAKYGAPA